MSERRRFLESKVGDIYVRSWGVDQPNVDFYEVTKLTASGVWIRPLQATEVYDARNMTGTKTPLPGQYTGPAMLKRGPFLIPRDPRPWLDFPHAWATIWDGKPAHFSDYG